MSFGFGVGDFLAAFELASKVRSKWVDAPQEYASIKNETRSLENILREVGQLGDEIDLSPQQEDDLIQASKSCYDVLERCSTIVERYSTIASSRSGGPSSSRVRRAWKRFRLDPDDIRHVRDQLSSSVALLSTLQEAIQTRILDDVNENVQNLLKSDEQQERDTVADWYAPADFAGQLNNYLKRRQPGTGYWFLNHTDYCSWRRGGCSTLVCPGIPGSGKTIMAAAVIDDLRDYYSQDKDTVVIYLFCNFGRRSEQDLDRLLASLVRQLFQEQSPIPRIVKEVYLKHRDRGTQPSLDELKSLLHQLTRSYAKVFILVDALDECDNNGRRRDLLLDELFLLQKNEKRNTNILVTTRFIPAITDRFLDCAQIEVRAREEDMRQYLNARMLELRLRFEKVEELRPEVVSRIITAADGMFLLVKLHFESLLGWTKPSALRNALDKLPTGKEALSEAYSKAIERIDQQLQPLRLLARHVLMWISHTRRELTIEELQEAVAIVPDMIDIDHEDDLDDESEIVSVCAGLVVLESENRVVRLVHYTTQEYLETIRNDWLPGGPKTIVQSCLTYLSMETFDLGGVVWHVNLAEYLNHYRFLEYAGKLWGAHAKEIDEGDEETQDQILRFLLDRNKVCFASQVMQEESPRSWPKRFCPLDNITALHIAARYNLHQAARHLITQYNLHLTAGQLTARNDMKVNSKDNRRRTPLSWSAYYGSVEVARLLLSLPNIEADPRDKYGRSPLASAVDAGCIEIVQLLLNRDDVDPDSRNSLGATPLSSACMLDHTEIVKLLLQHPQVHADVTDGYGLTPLFRAASRGTASTVQLLLTQPGVKANTTTVSGETPLHFAAARGHTDVVRLLLAQTDVDVNSEGNGTGSPLLRAAKNRRLDVFKLLAADPRVRTDVKDRHGNSARYYAVRWSWRDASGRLLLLNKSASSSVNDNAADDGDENAGGDDDDGDMILKNDDNITREDEHENRKGKWKEDRKENSNSGMILMDDGIRVLTYNRK